MNNYLGNFYGKHDGYDGSVYHSDGISKAVVASVGGIALILVVRSTKDGKEHTGI